MNTTTQAVLEIIKAEYVKVHVIRLTFKDRTVKEIDFGPFLRHAKHPAIRAYLDLKKFKSFHVECGDLMWGDYELCFPIADLYEGRIS